MKIILHIGRHKTGTTTIQNFCALNYDKLKENSVLYPKAGRENFQGINHHGLFSVNSDGKYDESKLNESEMELLLREILQEKPDFVIISSEIFSRKRVSLEVLEKFSSYFDECEFRVFAYLRKPSDFLLSTYSERIKRGLISRHENIKDIDAELNYLQFMTKFIRTFGSEAIYIKIFERVKKGNICLSILSEVNMDFSNSTFKYPVLKNKSETWLYLYFLKYVSISSYFHRVFSNRFVRKILNRSFNLAPDVSPPLNQEEALEIDKMYEKPNQTLFETVCNSRYPIEW